MPNKQRGMNKKKNEKSEAVQRWTTIAVVTKGGVIRASG